MKEMKNVIELESRDFAKSQYSIGCDMSGKFFAQWEYGEEWQEISEEHFLNCFKSDYVFEG